ncbi:MAG: universal stress protein [Rhizomicrobium sp.]|nr:universal stress protein [Rhizomicrobium sp.]
MTYATVMVHLELGHSNAPILRVAANLAETLHASLIGIAGSQLVPVNYNDTYISGDVVAEIAAEEAQQLTKVESEFRNSFLSSAGTVEWRSTLMCSSLPAFIATQARSADLVLTTAASSDMADSVRVAEAGELILQIGRPVLCVPGTAQPPNLDSVILAWKESREARRAALDALPLLKLARQVAVVELAEDDELNAAQKRVDDVGSWLNRHGVSAECRVLRSLGDEAQQLIDIATNRGAGVIVAGAYGHSRLREFVFGGVTRALLSNTECCSLLSH